MPSAGFNPSHMSMRKRHEEDAEQDLRGDAAGSGTDLFFARSIHGMNRNTATDSAISSAPSF
jgi:hypothetical protein